MKNIKSIINQKTPLIASSFWNVQDQEELKFYQKSGLDLAEIRIDQNRNNNLESAQTIIKSYEDIPTILTIRTGKEGGAWARDEATRLKWFRELCYYSAIVDVELNSQITSNVADLAKQYDKPLILSSHFIKEAWDLATMRYQATRAIIAGADIFKFAATINNKTDLAVMQTFLNDWNKSELTKAKKLILSPLGESNFIKNSRLSFAKESNGIVFVHCQNKTAPGQPSLASAVNYLKIIS